MMTTLSFDFEKENSLDDEVKCLMAQIVESHPNTSHDIVGILNTNSPHTAKALKSEWDGTLAYQVKNHVYLFFIDDIKKYDTIDILCFNLLISNKENSSLSLELKIHKEKLSSLEKSPFVLEKENICISRTNNFLHTEKEKVVDHANHTQIILN